MPVLGGSVLVSVLASALCLGIIVSGIAKGKRAKMIAGGLGVAALMIAIALIADAFR